MGSAASGREVEAEAKEGSREGDASDAAASGREAMAARSGRSCCTRVVVAVVAVAMGLFT